MAKKLRYKISHLKTTKVTIAIAQIEGPLPNGKHKSLLGERDTWVWKSIENVNARIDKACEILDAISRFPQKVDIIVFPEYSIPVEKAIPRLQHKANQHQQIIVGGADSIHDSKTNKIYNECPVFIPGNRRPIWVIKREVSQWEQGLIDEPNHVKIPVFTWEVDGREYWFAVFICLDFRHAKNEFRHGGGIFLVPMCSPDVHSFRGWADDALRLENGTATVLCNCIGDGATGQSGVVAVLPDGKPFKSAFDLPETKEAIAVFDIDLRQLSPPKKTVPGYRFPLGRRYFYSLHTTSGRIDFTRLKVENKELVTRGVINPAIFEYLGKKMRIAFLSVDNFWEVVDKLKGQDFEVLAILGQHDLLVTHLHENRYDMIYDVRQVVNWRSSEEAGLKHRDGITDDLYNNFPFFRADVYFKVLGVKIEPGHRTVFERHRMPTLEERIQIMKLGSDWTDEQVSEEERERFVKNGWIIKTTDISPGEISFIMTISLDHVGPELEMRQVSFENQVMPQIVNKKIVTSVYRGRPQSLAMNYILRIWSSLEALYGIIEEIYKLAMEARVSITTTTYVVLKKLSDLSLEKAVLAPMLTAEETNYRNSQIAPRLSKQDRDHLVFLPTDLQSVYIKRYQFIRESIGELEGKQWLDEKIEELERKLARGLLYEDFPLLKEPHEILQTRVETVLRDYVNTQIKDEEIENWKAALNIPHQKKRNDLSFTDRVKLAIRLLKERNPESNGLESLSALMDNTTRIRNAFAHNEWERITLETYVEALHLYSQFLSHWDT